MNMFYDSTRTRRQDLSLVPAEAPAAVTPAWADALGASLLTLEEVIHELEAGELDRGRQDLIDHLCNSLWGIRQLLQMRDANRSASSPDAEAYPPISLFERSSEQ
jgi:hypothetical protein